jgi:tetratricopeptide (TPR) repeat protein
VKRNHTLSWPGFIRAMSRLITVGAAGCLFTLLPYRLSLLSVILTLTVPAYAVSAEETVDAGPLISAARQNRSEAARLADQVSELVRAGNYQRAEAILEELLTSRKITGDGHRLLEKVYYRLSAMEEIDSWNRWCGERSESHFPFTVRGMYYYERVRFLDGANQSLLLTQKQRHQFNHYLRQAQSDIETALDFNSKDAGPAATNTALALHQKLPRNELEKRFELGVELDPAWLDNYRAKLLYLAPWWFGSDQKMEHFARQCFIDKRPGSNTYIVTLEYLALKSDRLGKTIQSTRFLLKPSIYQMVDEGFERYVEEYPKSEKIEQHRQLREQIFEQPYIAIAAFSESLDQDPENLSARRGRISAYLKNNQFSEAEGDLEVLERLAGITPFSLAARAEVAFRLRQNLNEGHRLIDQAVAMEISGYRRKQLYYGRAEFYRSRGRYQQAVADYSAAIDEDPLFEQAYFGRAQSYHAQGNLTASLEDLKILRSSIGGTLSVKARSLMNSYLRTDYAKSSSNSAAAALQRHPRRLAPAEEVEPDAPDFGYRKSLIDGLRSYYQRGFEQARSDFLRVLSSDPANAKAYFMLGRISANHDYDSAAACIFYKQAYRLEPRTPDYVLEMSRCLYKQRRFSSAISAITAFLDSENSASLTSSPHAQLLFARGLCFEERGLITEALADMQEALALDPGLRAAEQFIKDHAGASQQSITVEQLTTLPNLQARDVESTEAVTALLEQGRQRLLDGDINGARIAYLKAIRLSPESGAAHYYLGRLYFEYEHDYIKALLYYNQAIAAAPQRADYYFDRAALHYYFEQYERARADFTTVLELRPSHDRSLYYRGVCNHYLGNREAARKDFQALREVASGWDMEIERFRNSWKAEIEQFLGTDNHEQLQ